MQARALPDMMPSMSPGLKLASGMCDISFENNVEMDLSSIDLNLLRILHRLLQERHVSRAAQDLGLSQPAVSNALRRLRVQLGDDLLVRSAAGMQPTPLAQRLAGPIAQALELLDDALRAQAPFDPADSVRQFTLAMSDVGELYFLPVLMRALAQLAPGVTLRTTALDSPGLGPSLSTGEIDLALGSLPRLQGGFYQQSLFRQGYLCLMRNGHPMAEGPLTRAAFLACEHVRVEAPGTGHGRVDSEFERRGIRRRIRLSVPNYVALGHVLASTDLIATVPERFAERVCAALALRTHPLPVRIASGVIRQFWHQRSHRDSGHEWLRRQVSSLFADSATRA